VQTSAKAENPAEFLQLPLSYSGMWLNKIPAFAIPRRDLDYHENLIFRC